MVDGGAHLSREISGIFVCKKVLVLRGGCLFNSGAGPGENCRRLCRHAPLGNKIDLASSSSKLR